MKASAAAGDSGDGGQASRRRDVRGRRTVTGICKWSWMGMGECAVLRHGCCDDSCHGNASMHAALAVAAAEGCKALDGRRRRARARA